jgi:adenosylcobinamide-phosphate synthase
VNHALHLSKAAILFAFAIDVLLGDPKWLPHPVALIGRIVSYGERILLRGDGRGNLWRGAMLTVSVAALTAAMTWSSICVFDYISTRLGVLAAILIAWTTIAARSLDDAALTIEDRLAARDLAGARVAIPALVGRDPESLDCEGMIRATIESLAENASDAIIAPLFYLFVAGPVGAMVYKAVNTLDSMIGYRDQRYIYFGRFAARLDDVANFVPARITAVCIALSALPINGRVRDAIATCFRDASKHASPNAGWPEAAMAGALGVQLGGNAVYQGALEERASIGDAKRPLQISDIPLARTVVRVSTMLAFAMLATSRYFFVAR